MGLPAPVFRAMRLSPRLSPLLASVGLLCGFGAASPCLAGDAAPASLLENSGFEVDADADGWPDHWPKSTAGVSWETESGGRFLRFASTGPGRTVSLRKEVAVPAGAPALELGWRWRRDKLKAGRVGQDFRFLVHFLDGEGSKIEPTAPTVYTRVNSEKEWRAKTHAFLVPAAARTLVLEPSLIEVTSGVVDLDDITLRPTDPAPVIAAAREREEIEKARHVPLEEPRRDKWPLELRVEGRRLLDASGKELWLQGLNAGGLEMEPLDTQPIKSLVVGIEEWKARIIRLPVKDRFWFGEDPRQTDGGAAYRGYVDQCVTLAANRGAYIIIDLHEFRAVKPQYLKFWKDAAARYANHPAVVFELLNEPFGTTWDVWRNGGFVTESKGVDESAFLSEEERKKNQGFESVGMQPLLDAIRATGAKNVVIVGGLHWSFDLRGVTEGYALEDPNGNGLVYSWHVYNWHKGWEKHVLAAAEKHPVLVGEVGADIKKMPFLQPEWQEDPYTWVPDILGFIQKHRLHWTAWCFHPEHTPVMISDWKYTPTPFWGVFAKDALAGKPFELKRTR